jgi:hypothetical protein
LPPSRSINPRCDSASYLIVCLQSTAIMGQNPTATTLGFARNHAQGLEQFGTSFCSPIVPLIRRSEVPNQRLPFPCRTAMWAGNRFPRFPNNDAARVCSGDDTATSMISVEHGYDECLVIEWWICKVSQKPTPNRPYSGLASEPARPNDHIAMGLSEAGEPKQRRPA